MIGIIVVLILIGFVAIMGNKGDKDERYTNAFTALSALNLSNQDVTCYPGTEDPTGSFGGACSVNHHLII